MVNFLRVFYHNEKKWKSFYQVPQNAKSNNYLTVIKCQSPSVPPHMVPIQRCQALLTCCSDQGTEAQGRSVTSFRSHSQEIVEPGIKFSLISEAGLLITVLSCLSSDNKAQINSFPKCAVCRPVLGCVLQNSNKLLRKMVTFAWKILYTITPLHHQHY